MANEKRLIDANEVYELHGNYPMFARSRADLTDLQDILDEATTVDAVEVVRCKDCQFYLNRGRNCWCDIFDKIIQEDGYCCFGERKPNETNNL